MLYINQCGRIIVRLLFDSVDYTFQMFDYITEFKYNDTMEDLQKIVFFVLRVCYLNFKCSQ